MTQISCIIPVHNEAPRIAAVLAAVAGHPDLHEVIVIDDGSTDGTGDLVAALIEAAPNTRLIRLSPNRGKTGALSIGISEASAPLLMLIDGDLLGLTADHIAALAAPVRAGRAEMSISLRDNAPRPWHWIGLDYISGERVLPRAVLEEGIVALDTLPRFGFEVHLNSLALRQGLRISVVRWRGVRSPLKGAKMGRWPGIKADFRMMGDIFRTVPPHRIVAQIARMRARRVS
jgi:glycosyltransferase involved in cell wall biosynthesis